MLETNQPLKYIFMYLVIGIVLLRDHYNDSNCEYKKLALGTSVFR